MCIFTFKQGLNTFGKRWSDWVLCIFDILAIVISYYIAFVLKYDSLYSKIPAEYINSFLKSLPIHIVIMFIIFNCLGLYRSLWCFAGYQEIVNSVIGIFLCGVSFFVISYGISIIGDKIAPLSCYLIETLFFAGLIFFSRFVVRVYGLEHSKHMYFHGENAVPSMLIGAGAAGQLILRDLTTSCFAKNIRLCCLIDDDEKKWGRTIDGLAVYGGRQHICEAVEKFGIKKIFLAIPRASEEQKHKILEICKETGCEIKTLPGLYQFANDEVTLAKMRDVRVEDLLGREPIIVNQQELFTHLSGKTILVTGGGGSIGSELCRQIASHSPKQLIIFDIYENNAYDIEQELRRKFPHLNLSVLIGSVRDTNRINSVFEMYRPEFVFHAAAHKHVPLMENSPCESIKNNVLGTYKTAYAALTHGCRRFLLISTDKAVNPTNIMGASKRLCEMVIQAMNEIAKSGDWTILPKLQKHLDLEATGANLDCISHENMTKTEFVAVRFGNVLGSNGSVIPLFKKQIAAGGPVTVTHPDIIRYFMTIPEAVSLVLQAGVYAKGGEIFVLDMGEPVKIVDLARNLIKLSGFRPDVDIKIQFSGLRPGEKLYEEKLMAEEGLERTPNKLIHIAHPVPFETKQFLDQLIELAYSAYQNNIKINILVESIVKTYHPL